MAGKKNIAQEPGSLTYKDKPLLRKGNMVYYGNTEDAYIVSLIIQQTDTLMDLELSTNILVQLQTNDVPGKERVLKSAEREGFYAALDLGDYWLTEILTEGE